MALIMPVFEARRAIPSLSIGGQDILLGLASQYIIDFSYTDATSDKADDLSLSVADPKRTWMNRYLPKTKKGVECTAAFRIVNWSGPGDTRTLECGIFYIDNVSFSGPPNVVSITAKSTPPTGIKETKKHKNWENTTLQNISNDIASQNGLTLKYDTQQNPITKRTDQTDTPDLEYLRSRCKEAGLSLKIHKKQIVIYSEEEYEARPPAFTLRYGASNIISWSMSSKNGDTFKEGENAFVNPETGKLTRTKFTPEEPPEGTEAQLMMNEGIEFEPDGRGDNMSRSEFVSGDVFDDSPSRNKGKGKGGRKNSERKVKSKMREKNKHEHQMTLTVIGNIDYLSGLTCQLQDFGTFDRKYFIESSKHGITGSGYTTELHLRGALKGY
jgi:hypothetical protein